MSPQEAAVAVDTAEAKRLRKAAKQAALEAEDDALAAKRQRKAARQDARDALAAEGLGILATDADEALEARSLRKAAKRAALQALAEEQSAMDADPEEAKRQRKAAKRAAAEDASIGNNQDVVAVEKGDQAADDSADEQLSTKKEFTPGEIEERRQKRKERKKKEREAKLKTRTDDETVFVAGIPFDCEEDWLRQLFCVCGEIDTVKMLLNKEGKHRGLAYISYKTAEEADAALTLDGTDFEGRVLSVKTSVSKRADLEVFVRHFPREEPDDALRKVFAPCGNIESLKIPRFEDGAAKGMAWIVFKDSQGLQKALKLSGKKIGDHFIEVTKSGQKSDEDVKVKGRETKAKEAGKGKGKSGKGKSKGKGKGKKKDKAP